MGEPHGELHPVPPPVDPHAVDPHAADHHAVDPHAVDPHAADHHADNAHQTQEGALSHEAQTRMNQLSEVLTETGNDFNEKLYMQTGETGLKGKLKNWVRRLFFVGGGAMQPATFDTLGAGAKQFGDAQAALAAHEAGTRALTDTALTSAIGARDASLGIMGQGALETAGSVLEAGAYTGGVSGLAQLAVDSARVCMGERSRNLLARHLSHEGFMNFNEQMKNMTLKSNRAVIEQTMKFQEWMKQGKRVPNIPNSMLENMLTSAVFEDNQIKGTQFIMPAEKWAKTMNGKDAAYFKQVEDSVRVLQRMAAERFSPEEMIDLKSRMQAKLARKQAVATTKAVAARTGITALKGFTGASLASAIIGGVKAWNPNISELPRRLLTQTAKGVGTIAEGAVHVAGEVVQGVQESAPAWTEMGKNSWELAKETAARLMAAAPAPAPTP